MLSKSRGLTLLVVILVIGFAVRFYRIDNPIADWHSWRQADTASVSRNFVTTGFDLLHPRFDDLSNVPSGMNNPEGYRFVEFPIYNAIQAGLFKLFGVISLEEWGRLISIISSLAGSLFLYKLVSKYSGVIAGVATAFFYTFLPFNIYYSRTILPDPSMAATIIMGIYFFDAWIDTKAKNWKYFLLSIVFTAIALLLKPYAVFYGIAFVALAYSYFGLGLFKQWKLWFFAIVSILPLIIWRIWITQFPEGIPYNSWLLNGNGIRFRPSFFYWIGYERITKLISGYIGIILLVVGLHKATISKAKILYLALVSGAVGYVTIFATGNVQHDYYQIVIMPVIAILYGLSADSFITNKSKKIISVKSLVFLILTMATLFFSWIQVKDYFNINNKSIIIAGKAIDEILPKNAKIIANYNGDTSFLYQTKRKGWASFQNSLPEMIIMGADYLVLANPSSQDEYFAKSYKIIKKTSDFMLFDLHQRP